MKRHLTLIQWVFVFEVILLGLGARESGDDGFYIAAAQFVTRGLKPFVDFSFSQGPVLPYLYAPVVYLFGPSLLVSRLVGIVLCLLLYYVAMQWVVSWTEEFHEPGWHDARTSSQLVFTYICILYPEVWAVLSRIGSKEALASICCVLSIGGLFMFKGKPYLNIAISSLFVGVSFGIKYTSVVVMIPLVLYVWRYFSLRHALAYCFLSALVTLLIFAPDLSTARWDFLAINFKAVKDSLTHPATWIERLSGIFSLYALTLAKYQILLIPAFTCVVKDLMSDTVQSFLKRKHNLLFIIFLYVCPAIYSLVTPAEHRVFMYVPLLFVFAAICVERLFEELKSTLLAWTGSVRLRRSVVAVLLLLILLINTGYVAAFGTSAASLSFSSVRWYTDRGITGALAATNEICSTTQRRTLLYVGYLHHHILPSSCDLSPLSSMSAHYLRLGPYFTKSEAERYGFLTYDLFASLVSERRMDVIVIDSNILDEDIEAPGIKGTTLRKLVEAEYTIRTATKYESVYQRKMS